MASSSDHLWTPTPESISRSTIGQFVSWLADRGIGPFASYDDLWRWSVDDIAGFWGAVWEFFDVQASAPYSEVLDSPEMPGTKWFVDARLNYAEHILRHHGDRPAIIARSQTRPHSSVTWDELAEQVGRARAGLQRLGVGRGDRVAAYLPNVPETIIAFLATASLGAIWTSCAPEFGVQAVLDRFGQIDPKVLLVVDGYRYGSHDIDRRAEVRAIRDGLRSVQATVALQYLDDQVLPDVVPWTELVADPGPVEFEQVAGRSPAVRAVFIRHHGHAEAHRARPRRHPARTPQGPGAARRPGARRPVLLVHDDRLDDVELPRQWAVDRRGDRDLRR